MTGAMRMLAIAIAVSGLIDPGVSVTRRRPLPVDVRAIPSHADPQGVAATRVRDALLDRMGPAIGPAGSAPRAIVTIGGGADAQVIVEGVPISTVTLIPRGRNIAVVDVHATPAVALGQRAAVSAVLHASDAQGTTSIVTLERDGLEVARRTHEWRAVDEHATIGFSYAPMEPGVAALRVRALPIGGEIEPGDNVADVAVRTIDRALRVLAWEPRPSWSGTFVRRALEADPAFDVSARSSSSRHIDTSAGAPPAALAAPALERFDIVIVGAPEELGRRDVDALDTFARDRGGTVVLLPDRAPAGEYRRLLPAGGFQEVLLDRPLAMTADGGLSFRGSELAVADGGEVLASATHAGRVRPVVVSWPRGVGTVVFSGALDAWRFRGDAGHPFVRFWTGMVATLALQAPPSLFLSVEPPYAAPGDLVTIRARYRASELSRGDGRTISPSVRGEVVSGEGQPTPVRLWPSPAPGEYEGTWQAPGAGRFDVRVSGGDGLVADAPLVIAADARTRRPDPSSEWLASATGGVAAHASDTARVETFLRQLPRPSAPAKVHPMRSGWWIVPFAVGLCAEWALRRRKGLR